MMKRVVIIGLALLCILVSACSSGKATGYRVEETVPSDSNWTVIATLPEGMEQPTIYIDYVAEDFGEPERTWWKYGLYIGVPSVCIIAASGAGILLHRRRKHKKDQPNPTE